MKKQSNVTLNELITEKMAMLANAEKHNTAHNYRSLLHFIQRNFGLVLASDADASFVRKMDAAMSGLSDSTKATYYACLKSIWYYAEYKGYIKCQFPFRRKSYQLDLVKIPRMGKRNDCWLTVDEMSKLYAYWTVMEDGLRKRYIGLFLASYLMNGSNLMDIMRLRYSNEWYHSQGKVLTFVRHKTAEKSPVTVRIPVTDWLKPILNYMADEPVRGGLVFGSFMAGVPNNEKAIIRKVTSLNNSVSKILRKELPKIGLRDDVSTTWARHSFFTNANHLGFNYSVIEAMGGHSLSGVSGNYIGQAPIDRLFEVSDALLHNIA